MNSNESTQSKKKIKRHPKSGRPKAIIDWEKVKVWLRANSTATEIAGKLGIDRDTLYNRSYLDHKMDFSAWAQEFREYGALDLRLVGYDEAVRNRNTRMLIHLHEWTLGQREKRETEDEKPSRDEVVKHENENMMLKAQLALLNKKIDDLQAKIDNESKAGS
jgi:hypothetical protein